MTITQIHPQDVRPGETVMVRDSWQSTTEKLVVENRFRNGMVTLVFADGTRLTQNEYSTVPVCWKENAQKDAMESCE